MLSFAAVLYKINNVTQSTIFSNYKIPINEFRFILSKIESKIRWKENKKSQIYFTTLEVNKQYPRNDKILKYNNIYRFTTKNTLVSGEFFNITKNTTRLIKFLLLNEEEFDNSYYYSCPSDNEDNWSEATRDMLQIIEDVEFTKEMYNHTEPPKPPPAITKDIPILEETKLDNEEEQIQQKTQNNSRQNVNEEENSKNSNEEDDRDTHIIEPCNSELYNSRPDPITLSHQTNYVGDEFFKNGFRKYESLDDEEKKNLDMLLRTRFIEPNSYDIWYDRVILKSHFCHAWGDFIKNRHEKYIENGSVMYKSSRISRNSIYSFAKIFISN